MNTFSLSCKLIHLDRRSSSGNSPSSSPRLTGKDINGDNTINTSSNDKITDECSISNNYQGEKSTTNGKSPSTIPSSLATKSQNLQGKVNLIAPIAVTEELDADDCETESEANEGKSVNWHIGY